MIKNFVQGDIEKIQIDEGIVVLNYKLDGQKILGPTRGGVEGTIAPKIRDIDFDGRRGKTKGLQVKDEEDVTIKIKTLCCSQENLKLATINTTVAKDGTKKIEQGDFGVIKKENYLENIAVVTKTLDNKYKVLIVKNAMHEGNFDFKFIPKAENEHNLEFYGHYNPENLEEKIWSIEEADTDPLV